MESEEHAALRELVDAQDRMTECLRTWAAAPGGATGAAVLLAAQLLDVALERARAVLHPEMVPAGTMDPRD